jgi:hypothetical protein
MLNCMAIAPAPGYEAWGVECRESAAAASVSPHRQDDSIVTVTNSGKALGFTQPLTEMSKARSVRKADNLTAISEPIVKVMWDPQRLRTLWAFTACYRDSFTYFLRTVAVFCSRTFKISEKCTSIWIKYGP